MPLKTRQCPSINGLFAQALRYAQKIILGILHICLWLFFSHALILNKSPHFWMDTSEQLLMLTISKANDKFTANSQVKTWGGENRRIYRWNFNPIFVPYVSGVRNDEQRR